MEEQFLFILFEWKFYCFLHCFLSACKSKRKCTPQFMVAVYSSYLLCCIDHFPFSTSWGYEIAGMYLWYCYQYHVHAGDAYGGYKK